MISPTPITDYLATLASGTSTPGGGAAAGLSGAQGAALISMVSRLSRTHPEPIAEILAAADQARDRFIRLVDEDMQCFEEVMKAYKLRAKSSEEKVHKHERLQQALKDAADPPGQMIDQAVRLIPLTKRLAEIGNRNLITDVGIAASHLACVLASSRLNVLINLKSIDDRSYVGTFDGRLATATEMIEQARDVNNQVEMILQQS